MNVGRAFTFLTEDQNWIMKLVVGAVIALLSFLIFPAFFLIGYMVAVTRQVMNGKELPLPEWGDDLGKLFMDGFFVFLAQLVYTLPFWLLACIGTGATIFFGAFSDQNADLFAGGAAITWIVISCLFVVFAIVLFFISPAIVIQYAREGELSACFRFNEVIGIARDNIGNILIVTVANLVVSFVISLIAAIPCVGWIVALLGGPYTMVATGHLYGQIAANMHNKGVTY